jgi:two-component system sensor histidine kinase TctE
MPKPTSLRGELLRWLLMPLLGLSVIGAVILCYLAFQFSDDVFDRDLHDAALELRHEIREIHEKETTVDLGRAIAEEAAILLSDRANPVSYNVVNGAGIAIARTAELPLPPEPGMSASLKSAIQFYDATIGGRKIRIASLPVSLGGRMEDSIKIQVAEGINRRNHLAHAILAVSIPQVLLLTFLVVLAVVYAVRRGIRPLNTLGEAIARRSWSDLAPVDPATVPLEARHLVSAINGLMQRVKGASESQQRAAADAAHVMQTPLTGMKAQVELGLRHDISEETRRVLSYVKEGVDRLSHLLRELSVLARSDPIGTTNLRLTQVELQLLLCDVATEWVPIALRKKIDLGCAPCPPGVAIQGDVGRLKNLLDSLLDNAIRYTPSGGRVTIGCDPEEPTTIHVSDNGSGIPLEERGRVFDRFYRVPGSGVEGSGLGLAIVKEIAQQHGATVELREGPGLVGTDVRVAFPTMDQRPRALVA